MPRPFDRLGEEDLYRRLEEFVGSFTAKVFGHQKPQWRFVAGT
jgi:hypothetical protein